MLTIEEIPATAVGPALRDEWNALVLSTRHPSVFLSWEWIRSWLDVYGDTGDLLILLVRDGESLVGIAPFCVNRDRSWPWLRRLQVIGQTPTYGEYLDVVAPESRAAEIAEVVVAHLTGAARRRWDVVYIQRMLADSPVLEGLRSSFERHGRPTQLVATQAAPYLPLPHDVDDLMEGRSSNFRRQMNQSVNRTQRLGQIEIRRAGIDMDFDEAFAILRHLHASRWDSAGSFDGPDRIRFHEVLGPRLIEHDHLYLAVLSVDGTPIGARYDFVFDQRIWCVQGGWDPEHKAVRPGLYMTRAVLEWGIEQGLTEYDFLAGTHDYKLRWTDTQRALVSLLVANPTTPRGRIYHSRRLARA